MFKKSLLLAGTISLLHIGVRPVFAAPQDQVHENRLVWNQFWGFRRSRLGLCVCGGVGRRFFQRRR